MKKSEPTKIGEMLLSAGIVTEEQLARALEYQAKEGGRLGSSLVKIGAIDEDVLATFLAMQRGTDTISLSKRLIPREVLTLVSTATAYRFGAIPVSRADKTLTVVLVDPEDREALKTLERETGCQIRSQIAPQTSIYDALKRLYPTEGSLRTPTPSQSQEARERLRRKLKEIRQLAEEIERELYG